jgi:alpha-mannosidase
VQRHAAHTRKRIAAVLAKLHNRVHAETEPVPGLSMAGPTGRISLEQAARLEYRPARLGDELGPLWATFWLRGVATVPESWAGSPVALRFSSHSEATLWIDSRPVQGLNDVLPMGSVLDHRAEHEPVPTRTEALLLERAAGNETIPFVVEIACNGLWGDAEVVPYQSGSPFRLDFCELVRIDQAAHDLAHDLDVLVALEREMEASDPSWAGLLISELNRFCNACDPERPETWEGAGSILKGLLDRRNGSVGHELTLIGHAHIDTQWLWPAAESVRKCIRTFSSQTAYMERYPDYRFACSQALHYAWIKERQPDLWERIVRRIESGQWLPVGATWIEPDCNLPSGELLVRQFLVGQRFFEQELGGRSTVFWNPDAFGYNGQLPQIMRGAGVTRFLTQKLSSNQFTDLHANTFVWQGIDGSQVAAHIPPAGTFNSGTEVSTLRRVADAYRDHDRSGHSLLLFGHGDGGGGPTPRMLENLSRTGDLAGLPRTRQRSADAFFELIEEELGRDPLVIVGELFYETHQGTFTSQARTKQLNLRCERALHDAELLSSIAHRLGLASYPREEMDAALRTVLLHQFHDVLPGTSIREVHEQVEQELADAAAVLEAIRDDALGRLAEDGAAPAPFNTTGRPRIDVAEAPGGELALCTTPAHGAGTTGGEFEPVTVDQHDDGSVVVQNRHLTAVLGQHGAITSLVHRPSGREALSSPGNRLELYEDHTTRYDAWDIEPFHLETCRDCPPAERCEVVTEHPLRVEVAFQRSIGERSSLRQVIRLDAEARRLEIHNELDWHERHRLLKVAFPVQAHAPHATFQIQFGTVQRPTHHSTAWDLARYEVPGQRFSDLSEHGFGVALLSDSKYGYSAYEDTLRISLMRAPTNPDPETDQGRHRFAYAVMPHAGGWQDGGVVAEAAAFTSPIRFAGVPPRSFAQLEDPNLVLDSVKLAEDSDDLVLRLYEAHGSRGTARLLLDPPPRAARLCNLLEDDGDAIAVQDGAILVAYRPHEIITLKVSG